MYKKKGEKPLKTFRNKENRSTVCIHISEVDKKIIMNEGVRLFLNDYPMLEGTHITIKQMFTSMTKLYIAHNYNYHELINKYSTSDRSATVDTL